MCAMASSNSRARRKPSLMRKLPSRRGSLMKPFQPTVVRGFSKYTRITSSRSCRSCVGQRVQPARILERQLAVVDRAWPNDDQQARIVSMHDGGDLPAHVFDEALHRFVGRQLVLQQRGRNQRADVLDANVVQPGRERRVLVGFDVFRFLRFGHPETVSALQGTARQPARSAPIQLLHHRPLEHRHVHLDGVANAGLDVRQVPIPFRKRGERRLCPA